MHLLKRAAGNILWRVANLVKQRLPYNRAGDRVFSFIKHLRVHHRIPRKKSNLLNDRLYFMKANELSDALRQLVTDKEHLKLYVSKKCGDKYNIPTLAILADRVSADAFTYPARCVIKPTHASGEVIVRQRGEPIDRQRIAKWFSLNFYESGREQNYKNLTPKVIVEPILFNNADLEDFKIFCVRGVPKLIQVDFDRRSRHTRSLYSPDWIKLPFGFTYPIGKDAEKPRNLPEMLEIAKQLSADFSLIRVDLYSDGTRTYVGELTHCPTNAEGIFIPRPAEKIASAMLFGSTPDLPEHPNSRSRRLRT
jgi:TupA-like ATPgrasp